MVVSDLVKVILVQLSNEASKVGVLEMLWKDMFCELFVLEHDEAIAFIAPSDDTLILWVLQHSVLCQSAIPDEAQLYGLVELANLQEE